MSSRRTAAAIAVAALLAVVGPPPDAQADDQADARRLRQSGEIVPLREILRGIEQRRDGRILEAELKRRGDRYVYVVEVLGPGGEVWGLEFDARSGRLLRRSQER